MNTPIDKRALNLWRSSGGKAKLADALIKMLSPAHDTYTEVFAGSASVFFRKGKVAREALNDSNTEIAKAFELTKALDDRDIDLMAKMPWVGDRKTWNVLNGTDPTKLAKVERLYRFLYLTKFAFGGMIPAGFAPDTQGKSSAVWKRLARARDRMKGVSVFSGDYAEALAKFDGSTALHFLDPPYPGYNARIGEGEFDEKRFMEVVKGIAGKFLITYGARGEFPKMLKDTEYTVKRIYPRRAYAATGNMGGAARLGTLVVSNYAPEQKFAAGLFDDDDFVVDDWSDDVLKIAEDDDIYAGIDLRPTADMAIVALANLEKTTATPLAEPVSRKIRARDPLTVDEAFALASLYATPGPEVGLAAYGGDAGAHWIAKTEAALLAREAMIGRRTFPVGDGIRAVDDEIVLKADFVSIEDGEVRVDTVDEDLASSAAGLARFVSEADTQVTKRGFNAYVPMYDLVLVPSPVAGRTLTTERVLKEYEFEEGDRGRVSVQHWGRSDSSGTGIADGAEVVTRIVFSKAGCDYVQTATLATPLVGDDRLAKVAEQGAGYIPVMDEYDAVPGTAAWRDRIDRRSAANFDALQGDDVVGMKSGEQFCKQTSLLEFVAGAQGDGFHELFVDGTAFSGRCALVKVGNTADKAVWTRAYINDLPDAAFLWIAPGGKKDPEAKTTPRSKRYFPVRDASGVLDIAHLRNAIARIPRAKHKDLGREDRTRLREKARAMLIDADAEVEKIWCLAKFAECEGQTFASVAKAAPDPDAASFVILSKNTEKRIALGPVLVPDETDLQGDIEDAETIEAAAHDYLIGIFDQKSGQGVMHRDFEPEIRIVESYIAPVDFEMGGQEIKKGTWMLAFKFLDDETWKRVRKGELRGFSIGGYARRTEHIGEGE